MSSVIILDSEVAPPLPIRKFTVAQYHQLGELGVLTSDDRVELLEGWIVEKTNQGVVHGFVVQFLSIWLNSQVAQRVDMSMSTSNHNSPQLAGAGFGSGLRMHL